MQSNQDAILNLLSSAENEWDWVRIANRIRGLCHTEAGVACPHCRGQGYYTYGSGSTWRGGVGTCAMTEDICNVCWGTGRSDNTGWDLKKLTDQVHKLENEHGREASSKWLSDRMGLEFDFVRKLLPPIAERINKMRGVEFWSGNLIRRFTAALLEMAAAFETTDDNAGHPS